MENFFRLKEHGTTVRKEIIAGLTTFFAMAYIVLVNPNQIAAGGSAGWLVQEGADAAVMGQLWNAVFIASILGAVIGTLLYALYAKLPYAQACGMGLNSFFCTTFVSGAYFSQVDVITGYHAGLVVIFLSGILFMAISLTGARKYIARNMPDCLKKAIPAGIGLFIAFIGFQDAGVIQANQYTLTQLFDFHGVLATIGTTNEAGETVTVAMAVAQIAPVVVALLGFVIIAVLTKKNVKGSVLIGIVASTVLYYVLTLQVPSFDFGNVSQSFKDFADIGFLGVFDPAGWKDVFGAGGHVGGIFNAVMLVITFCLVDMFDTLGTLYGTASQADMLDENGDPIRLGEAMTCDSTATLCGSLFGCSTVTTFVECSTGVVAGGRTGLTSLVTAICFACCLVLSPIASIVPICAIAPALIYVGVLMLKGFAKVDMNDPAQAAPVFMALIMMVLTYSISNGIGMGAIVYVLVTLFTGKYTKKDIMVTVIALLFVLRFVMVTM